MNLENPRVTVRMSAYNHEAYVEEAIRSIINQTYQDFELLVVDDGSSDSTPEILERLCEEYGFNLTIQENQGLTVNLNLLNDRAKGEYITGCASDDYWPEGRLAEQVAYMDAHPSCDYLHGDFQRVTENGELLELKHTKKPVEGKAEFIPLLMRKRRFSAPSAMIRKSTWDGVGHYDETIAVEDFDWMLRAVRVCEVHHLSKIWAYYRKHGENWTMTTTGASRLADSSYMVAKKLGVVWGSVFLFFKSRYMYQCEKKIGRKRRFIFAVGSVLVYLFISRNRHHS